MNTRSGRSRYRTSSLLEEIRMSDDAEDAETTLTEQSSSQNQSPSPSKSIRKRSARISSVETSTSKELEELRFNFKEAVRGAFQSVDQHLTPYINQTKAVFLKLQNSSPCYWKAFKPEFTFRLNFMVQSIEPIVNRSNVYTMIVEATFALANETQTASNVLQHLISYCDGLQCAEDPAVRFNICCLVGILLDFWPIYPADPPSHDVLTKRQRDMLYSIIRSRRLDKNSLVRSQALKACRIIQDSPISSDFKQGIAFGPKDILHQALQDKDALCRVAAVETLTFDLTCNEHVQTLIDIAISDGHMQVRSAALRGLVNLNLNLLSKDQIRDLLQSVLFDTHEFVRKVAKSVLLKGWISLLAADIKKKMKRKSKTVNPQIDFNKESNHGWGAGLFALISKLPWIEDPDVVSELIFCAFDLVREELGSVPVSQFLLSLREDEIPPIPIMRYNCNIVMEHEMPGLKLALSCYYWRCLIEYTFLRTSKSTNSAERASCIHRLAPTLRELAVLARGVKTIPGFKGFSSSDEELQYLTMTQIAFKEILKALPFLEEDTCGVDEWRVTLEEALLDFTMKKDVTDVIAKQLAYIIYKENPMTAFEVFVNTTAQLVDKDINPDATIMNETLSVPNRVYTVEVNEVITAYCLQVINSILKTGIVKKMGAIVQDKYEYLLCPAIKNRDPTVRNWAIESVGILGLLDMGILERNWYMMYRGMKVECIPTKILCMEIICDWAIQCGINRNENLYDAEKFLNALHSNLLPETEDLKNPNLKVLERTIIACCKFFLCCPRFQEKVDWEKTISRIACLVYSPILAQSAHVKACLSQFFPCFVSTRRNQGMMVKVFWNLVNMHVSGKHDELISEDNLKTCLKMVLEFTKRKMVTNSKGQEKDFPSYHILICKSLLRYLQAHYLYKRLVLPSYCLLYFEYELFPKEDLASIFEDVSNAYVVFMRTVGEKSKIIINLRKTAKRILPLCEDVLENLEAFSKWD
ncbi:unnamed protein product [Auanema sp. JU1783]|nr:unnamed protein product [Auanema sp. JU1783]